MEEYFISYSHKDDIKITNNRKRITNKYNWDNVYGNIIIDPFLHQTHQWTLKYLTHHVAGLWVVGIDASTSKHPHSFHTKFVTSPSPAWVPRETEHYAIDNGGRLHSHVLKGYCRPQNISFTKGDTFSMTLDFSGVTGSLGFDVNHTGNKIVFDNIEKIQNKKYKLAIAVSYGHGLELLNYSCVDMNTITSINDNINTEQKELEHEGYDDRLKAISKQMEQVNATITLLTKKVESLFEQGKKRDNRCNDISKELQDMKTKMNEIYQNMNNDKKQELSGSDKVRLWLSELQLSEYFDNFVLNGFDDVASIAEIRKYNMMNTLGEIGIKKIGHKMKIIKAIQSIDVKQDSFNEGQTG
eukprot:140697_1